MRFASIKRSAWIRGTELGRRFFGALPDDSELRPHAIPLGLDLRGLLRLPFQLCDPPSGFAQLPLERTRLVVPSD
jgi:hypothetical protein